MQLNTLISILTQKRLSPSTYEGADYCYENSAFKFVIHSGNKMVSGKDALWILTPTHYLVFCDLVENILEFQLSEFFIKSKTDLAISETSEDNKYQINYERFGVDGIMIDSQTIAFESENDKQAKEYAKIYLENQFGKRNDFWGVSGNYLFHVLKKYNNFWIYLENNRIQI